MTEQDDYSIREIARAVQRIEHRQGEIADKVDEMASPLAVLSAQVADMKPKVDAAWWNAAFIAGGVSGIGFVINHFLGNK